MFVLHHGWKSSASRRVRLCMAEKGLKFESRIVNLAKMEHHTPEYLALNPNGVIPLLILPDGRSLYESSVICEYLDETYREPPLRPTDPYLRAEMRNWIRHVDERIGNLIVFNWKHSIQKTASQWSDEELKERVAKIPSKERQEAWMRVARRPFTKEEEDAARAKLVLLLDRMEANLKQHAWLVGDAYSLADIGVVPFVKRIDEEIAPDEVSDKKHPRVLAWWTAIQARPAFAEAKIGPFVES
jgi:glutathione S-transferase